MSERKGFWDRFLFGPDSSDFKPDSGVDQDSGIDREMSDFERELREAREEQRRQAELQRRAADEGKRQRVLDVQRSKRQHEEEAQRESHIEYEEYVAPVKPMVDRLMNDLARVTWGQDYGVSFQELIGSPRSGEPGYNFLAVWEFGLDFWYLRKINFFGAPVEKDRRPVFEEKKFRLGEKPYIKPDAYASGMREEYLVRLDIGKDVPFFVIPERTSYQYGNSPTSLDKTDGVSEVGLRDLLKREFLRGPRKTSIHYYGPNYRSSPSQSYKEGEGFG